MKKKELSPAKIFELYKKYTKEYMKVFGLQEYEIYYENVCFGDENVAEMASNPQSLQVIFCCNCKPEDHKCEKDIKSTALHEVLHCLLDPIDEFIKSRLKLSDREINTLGLENHKVINRLTNYLDDVF